MKYLGKITDNKDLVTKEYVDTGLSDKQDVLPVPTVADEGKFLRIVNGIYALSTVPEAAGEGF